MPDSGPAAAIPDVTDLSELLSEFSIHRVVYVDDYFSDDVQLPTLLPKCVAALLSKDEAERESLVGPVEVVESSKPEDTLRAELQRVLSTYDLKKMLSLAARLEIGTVSVSPEDLDTVELLKKYVNVELRLYSLSKWKAEADFLIEEHNGGKRTLFLFDLDLSEEQAGTAIEGVKLISATHPKAPDAPFGILSRKVGIEGEDGEWERLAQAVPLDKHTFLFAAKARLQESAAAFARKLRPMLAAPSFRQVQQLVLKTLKDSFEQAHAKIREIDILDFEQIVFRSSTEEGVWETDTLVRLFGVYQRREFKALAKSDEVLKSALAALSKVIPPTAEDEWQARIRAGAFRVQQHELYLDGPAVNEFLEPIELGDIFEVDTDSGLRQFVLLQQPCDLAVRGTGRRGKSVVEIVLVQVASGLVAELKEQGREHRAELPFYKDVSGTVHFVDLRAIRHVQDWVVDACAFNKDGVSLIDTEAMAVAGASAAWSARYPHLLNSATRYLKLHAALAGKVAKDFHPSALSVSNSLWLAPTASEDGKRISFKLKRVGRVTRELSQALLLRLSLHRSRPAFDHHFTRLGN